MAEPIRKMLKRAGVHSVVRHEQIRNFWVYDIPHGHSEEDVCVPEYWSNEAKKFRLMDRLELRAEDCSFWAEALVVAKSDRAMKIKVVSFVDLREENVKFNSELLAEYDLVFRGLRGHSVIRKSDKHVIAEDFQSEGEAKDFLTEYVKALQV